MRNPFQLELPTSSHRRSEREAALPVEVYRMPAGDFRVSIHGPRKAQEADAYFEAIQTVLKKHGLSATTPQNRFTFRRELPENVFVMTTRRRGQSDQDFIEELNGLQDEIQRAAQERLTP